MQTGGGEKDTGVEFTVGSTLRNPLISVICGSDDEEWQNHRLNGYVEKRRGSEDAEVRRGIVGIISALGLIISALGLIVSAPG
jgi:hypothetical protein